MANVLDYNNNNNNNNHLLDLKCMYINKNGSSLWIAAIAENQRLFTTVNLTMHILQIYFTWTKLKSEGRKKRDVVFRKNSGSREIRTPASCIAAIGANHYATPHPR